MRLGVPLVFDELVYFAFSLYLRMLNTLAGLSSTEFLSHYLGRSQLSDRIRLSCTASHFIWFQGEEKCYHIFSQVLVLAMVNRKGGWLSHQLEVALKLVE